MGKVGGWLVCWFLIGLNMSAKYLYCSPILLSWFSIILEMSPVRTKHVLLLFVLALWVSFFCHRNGLF